MRKMIIAVALALALVGVIVGFRSFTQAKQHAASKQPAKDAEDLAEMKRELGALRTEVRAVNMRTPVGEVAVQRIALTPAADSASAEMPQEPPSTPEEDEMRHEELIGQIAESFRGEVVDRAWSRQVESAIKSALDDDKVKLPAKSLECHAKTCRLELDGTDRMSQGKGLPLVANRMAGTFTSTVAHQESDGHGQTNTVLYFY